MQTHQQITYRQFHSNTIGPQHPLRVIAHCDIDAAYAQFEQVRLKIAPEKPLAVQQWKGLIAVNYPAREFGITRHLPFDEALKKCPNLICVHVATYAQGDSETEAKYHENPKPETHKVSLDPYRRESVKILKIFSESCDLIEKASIDEAFLDFSIPVRDILINRYSDLLSTSKTNNLDDFLPPPPQLDWKSTEHNLILNTSDSEVDEMMTTTWTDVALMIGAELMAQCRKAVFDQLGYTCSAGVTSNKMLAKLCSSYKKPNAQTVLRPSCIKSFLRDLEVSKIRFLGGKLGKSLIELIHHPSQATAAEEEAEESIRTTVGEVWNLDLSLLQNKLGDETGMWVWEIVRGIDKTEVEPKTQVKSMMSSKNFRPSISSWEEGIHWLRILSTDLLARLNEARTLTPGIWPKTIVMHKRDGNYNSTAKQIGFPFTQKLDRLYIFNLGQRLLQEFVIKENSKKKELGKITSLCLAFQTLERLESGQQGIEGFFKQDKGVKDFSRLLKDGAGQSLRNDPQQGSELGKESKEESVKLQGSSSTLKLKPEGVLTNFFNPPNPTTLSKSRLEYKCDRCEKMIRLETREEWKESQEEEEERFHKLKVEHSDEHFAKDLWNEDRRVGPEEEEEEEQPKKKMKVRKNEEADEEDESKMKKIKKKKKGGGIDLFFKPVGESSGRGQK
ncbi:uncharacterized protein MELLADRAFT_117712 [Melampsora larici-populina 98AG31]|uniref:DNA polymerase eta n=1 Tax=Melampsora larici-populina (strain 98AG31 / pathotype 3-4-7) TaxID=747676 RepID=F4S0M7_MELLP|nr:uncharacterized protein MELLADRAFT_117712 [Melampsora larici-populina 98AG31]EGG01839.1 hypothetical protein MELLADRAFT_117712 [Melampsora larici-populina 98AG31]